MKFIEDFRTTYSKILKKKEWKMWVLGCGPGLDDYPDDFFDDKIFIATNYAALAFPKFLYAHAGDRGLPTYLKEKRPELLKRSLFLHPLFGTHDAHWLGEYENDPVYMRFNCILETEQNFKGVADCIMRGGNCSYIVGGTCAHSAGWAAVVLGAKRVIFAGCEAKCEKYKAHAQKRGMSEFYKETGEEYSKADQDGTSSGFMRYKNGYIYMAKALQPYKIKILKHAYGKGYEKII